jgi:zinc protease
VPHHPSQVLRPLAIGLLLLGLSCLLIPAAVRAAGLQSDPGVRETVLRNGLRVLTKELHVAPVVTVWTWYRVGSRNERPGMTGLSHVLEHMLFRATSTMKTGDLDRLVARAGGKHNAFTNFDHTAYHITLPREALETALRLQADRMLNCLIDPDEVAKERGVVLSELQGRLNDPEELLEDVTRSIAIRVHPYRTPIIGWKTDVQAISADVVRDYYQTYYQPNNAVLVIVGDFQTDTVLPLIEKYFGSLPAGPPPPPLIAREPPQQGERRAVVKGAGTTSLLQFYYPVPPAKHADLYALQIMDAILTEGSSSRLHRALVEPEIAASVSSYLSRRIDAGWLAFYVTAREGMGHEKVEQAFLEALERMQRQPVSDFELHKAINQVRMQLTETYGSITGLAEALGTFEMTVGHAEFGHYLARLRQVTAADVQRVTQQYLSADNRTVGWFVPSGAAAPQASSSSGVRHQPHRSALWPESTPGGPQPQGQTQGMTGTSGGRPRPTVVRTVLPNGLTLLVVENRAVPSVAIKGYVLAAPIHDPAGKAGLAALTAGLLTRGTASTPADQLADTLDFLGASLAFQAEYQTVGIRARMLSEHFDSVLDAMADCLRNPAFAPGEVTKAIGRLQSRLKRDAEDIKDRAHRELFIRLFPPEHPLHRHPRGLIADLATISREDVLRFHAGFYRPERTVLVVVGDITQDRALAAAQRAFGTWPRLAATVDDSVPAMPAVPAMFRHTVELPGKSEAFAMLGGNGISRTHPDYYSTLLATRILGWGMTSRLMSAVREKAGMTYSIWSYFHPFRFERPFVIQFQADPAAMDRALGLVVAVAKEFCEKGATAEELADAKASLIGSLVLSMEDQVGQALVYRDTELFNLGLDYPQQLAGIIGAVTLDQVNSAAKKYIHPDRLVQIVVIPPPKQ